MQHVLLDELRLQMPWATWHVARDGFAGLVAIGVVTASFFTIMVNMLMTVGWATVTGEPLPFLSAGGPARVVDCLQRGLLHNERHRVRETW